MPIIQQRTKQQRPNRKMKREKTEDEDRRGERMRRRKAQTGVMNWNLEEGSSQTDQTENGCGNGNADGAQGTVIIVGITRG